MSTLRTQDQGIIELLQTDYVPILIESFLIDRKSQGLSPETISIYKKKLRYFLRFCEGEAVRQVAHLTPEQIFPDRRDRNPALWVSSHDERMS